MLGLLHGQSEAAYRAAAVEAGIPERMGSAYYEYVEYRAIPGDFLRAVLTNNLAGAVSQADVQNGQALVGHVLFCHYCLPAESCGSAERVKRWLSKGKEKSDER